MPDSDFSTLSFEQTYWSRGEVVAGLDEAGRGAWAGPVVAAAVILPAQMALLRETLAGVDASKKLTARQRTLWEARIRAVAVVGVGAASSLEIDEIGIVPATLLAMRRALSALPQRPNALLIDYIPRPLDSWPQQRLKRGESHSLSIAAASIVAKVYRDRWMVEEAERRWPGYGFARHKGYGTAQHRAALTHLGPSPIHRRTWAPLLQPRLFEP
jgi:ribonuclease HII